MAIFISYSHQDTPIVDRLTRELLKRNIKVWRDVWQNAPGDVFASRIESALAESSSACFFISRSAVDSAWVTRELDHALARASGDPDFVPVQVLLDDSRIPARLLD